MYANGVIQHFFHFIIHWTDIRNKKEQKNQTILKEKGFRSWELM